MADWRDRRVPDFREHLRNVLGREPTERDYAAAVMQLEQRGEGSVAVGHAFRNRIQAEGGDPASHLRHYDPIALGHRWGEVTPQAVDKWGAQYDRIAAGDGPLKSGQTHFFSPAGMQKYYDKDPSLVRSAVRMDVPGHGEVLVPNWATKAVAAGDYTPVNGEWFVTPNERYGRAAPEQAPGAQQVAASPSAGAVQRPVVASSDAAPTQPAAAKTDDPASSKSPSTLIDSAMRLAKAFSPSQGQAQDNESILSSVTAAPIVRSVKIDAPIPYMSAMGQPMRIARAEGGEVQANDFGELTPHQRAMLRKDAIEPVGLIDMASATIPMQAVGRGIIGGVASRLAGSSPVVQSVVSPAGRQVAFERALDGGARSVPPALTPEMIATQRIREEVARAVANGRPLPSSSGGIPAFLHDANASAYKNATVPLAIGDAAADAYGYYLDRKKGIESNNDGRNRVDRAAGGAIDDTGVNEPETPAALMAQQRQLIDGRRPAQMFPLGTRELPLPPGMDRIETPRGVFHFDPEQISAREIEIASGQGRENDILGLGPYSKDDVARQAYEYGERPVAITERDRDGNEVKASVSIPSMVADQSDEILRSASPGHSVDIEPVEGLVRARGMSNPGETAMRLARAEGGEVGSGNRPSELREWDPPWYDKLAYGAGDGIDYVRDKFGYGPLSTAQRGDVNQTVRTAPVLQSVIGVDSESRDARREFDHGNYGTAAGHLGMAGLHGAGLAGPVHAAQSATRGMPSVRQIGRDQRAWEANTPRGLGDAERALDRASAAERAAEQAANLRIRDAAELRGVERALRGAKTDDERQFLADLHRRMKAGEKVDVEDIAYAGHLQRQNNPTLRERLEGLDPDQLLKYGLPAAGVIGAAAGVAHNLYDSEVAPPNPNRDAEGQPGGFYGDNKRASGGGISDTIQGLVGSGLFGMMPAAYAHGVDEENLLSPMMGLMGKARGGGIAGPLMGPTGGRADQVAATVRSGSHVIPADSVSHLGQGNTSAGMTMLSKLFKTGPYGVPMPPRRRGFADGGEVPVMVSDGEFVVPPEVVAEIGGGDINAGHDVLDGLIMQWRGDAIDTLKQLPPPATD